MRRTYAGLAFAALMLAAPAAHAGAAMDAVRKNVDRVLEILRDPALKAQLKKGVDQKEIRPVYDAMFDEIELSKRALGKNWNALTAAQRQEFVGLFRRLLEKAYMDKILAYTDEKVSFDREIPLSPTLAEVQTRIVSATKAIPVTYRLILRNGTWKVYDVVAENISLVQNYRSQFNEILSKNPPERLIEILRKKAKE